MNNQVYIYNDNFTNLLTLIDTLIANNIKPYNIKNKNYVPNLLDEVISLEIVDNKKITNKIISISGKYTLKVMYYLYLSEDPNKELIIYYLCLNCFKYKNNILNMRNLKCVSEALKISKYVSKEAHRFKGFIRFKELKTRVLYAQIEPTNNVLEIVSNHFSKRLSNEYWMIKDNKRELISIYDKKNYYIINSKDLIVDKKVSDTSYEDLWITFYNVVGIKERKNDRCRMNFMPKKYWKNIIEMSDLK